ncbi:MAG: hypothetical protein J0I06_06790 [Planctomycetes bacterium]|nr:hypothetical protein [Planctomycetota bacterium]
MVLARANDPRRPNRRLARSCGSFKVDAEPCPELIDSFGDGLAFDRGPKEPLPQQVRISGCQPQRGFENRGLVLPDRVRGRKAILGQFARIDFGAVRVGETHVWMIFCGAARLKP